MNLAQQILLVEDRPTVPINLPEWGVSLFVQTLTAKDRDDYDFWAYGDSRENVSAKLVCRALVDEHGNRVFCDDDAVAVGNKSAKVVSRIFDVAVRHNGMRKSDLDELVKNSEAAPSGGS